MLHHSLADEELDLSRYASLTKHEKIPCLILGTKVKHQYDDRRLVFNSDDKIITTRVNNTVIRGIELPLNPQFDLLFSQLQIISDDNLSAEFYEKLLNSFNLSCSECYGYRRAGVYPVNGDYVKQLSTVQTDTNTYYEQFFTNTADCSWQGFSYLTLFILYSGRNQ